MRVLRPVIAQDPRLFGRRSPYLAESAPGESRAIGDDLKLFATTFAAGFLFVAVLIF
jgi:hypothetical protein